MVNNDLLDAAGVTLIGDGIFSLNEDLKIIGWDDHFTTDDPADYEEEFLNWLYASHPEAIAGLTFGIRQWYDRTPEDMAIVLEYLDEFVAQSDLYPVSDG